MYHEFLLFLLSNYEKEETSSTCDESMEAPDSYPAEEEVEIDDKKQIIIEEHRPQLIPRKRKAAPIELENGAESPSGSGFHVVDEDEAFLWSLLPAMKKLNRDDNFQFRIEVMQLLQKYKMQSKMQELQSSLNSSINT